MNSDKPAHSLNEVKVPGNHFVYKSRLTLLGFIVVFSIQVFAQNSIPYVISSAYNEEQYPVRTILEEKVNKLSVSYSFGGTNVSNVHVNGVQYQYLTINGFGQLGQIGAPSLPMHNDLIYIKNPNSDVKIDNVEYSEYEGYLIHPALKPATDTEGDPEPEFEIDSVIYNSDAFYPEEIVQVVEVLDSRGNSIAVVQLCPFQYNPVTKKLRTYSLVEYTIKSPETVVSTDKQNSEKKNSKKYYKKLKRVVINPNTVPDEYEESSPEVSYDDPTESNYIIITHSEYLDAANMLATWKKQLGLSVEVVSQSSWNTTQVKDAIYSRYNAWSLKPDYFVIIGDHNGPYSVPAESFISPLGETFYTDLYYACLDGGTDYLPDMAHGRISISNAAEAVSVVQKIIDYESSPVNSASFYNQGVNCSQYQDDNLDGYADRRFCHTSEEIRDYLQLEQGYSVERIYKTSASANPQYFNNGYYSDGQSIPSELLKSNGFLWNGSSTDITNSLNDGRFYIFHRDHGYVGGSGWASPYYTTSSLPGLTNGAKTPVVFSINCYTGEFSQEECFAERFLRLTTGGAAGVIAASSASLSGYNDGFSIGMIDAIWSNPGLTANFGSGGVSSPPPSSYNDIRTMGDVMNLGLVRMMETWDTYYARYEHELFHWFGDPAMKIWTTNPHNQVITASYPASVSSTATTYNISGCNVSNAIATLVHNEDLVAVIQLSGGAGTLSFDPIGASSHPVILTISSDNCLPLTESITVGGSTPPTYTWGNTEVFNTNTNVPNRRAVPITASENGSIESISIYHNGGGSGMLLGVYEDASGSPGSKLGGATATVSASEGWQTVNLTSPVSVVSGQTVWLAWVFENNPGIRYTTGTPGRANSPETWSGGMPESFGSSDIAAYIYSMYCTYSSSANATHYVSTTGSNITGDGSIDNPYATIQHAIDISISGDVIMVESGEYLENIVMKTGVSVIGADCENTTISGAAVVEGVVNVTNVTNAELKNFTITVQTPVPGYDRAIVFSGGTDNSFIVSHCIITKTQYGIFVWNPAKPIIENNSFVGVNDEQAIYIGNSATDPTIRNNIITGYYYGIHVVDEGNPPYPLIEYNDVWDNEYITGGNYVGIPDQTGLNGNISEDPLFVNVPSENYALQAGSPCINSGSPDSPLDPNGTIAEIGAIPFTGGAPLLWGNNTIFGSSTTASNRRAVPVTASEDGSIESISIYHNGGVGGVLLGVYSDASGLPGNQLGATPTMAVSGSAGWQTVDLNTPVYVGNGETVWLAWVFESNPGIRYETGTPGRANSPETWSGGMPTSFGSSTMENYNYSIYCTYTTGPVDYLELSPTELTIGSASGSEGSFDVSSNMSWDVTDDADWLSVSPISGSNNASVTCTATSENTGSSARTATVTVTGGLIDKTVSVTQEASSSGGATWGNTAVFGTTTTLANRRAVPITASEAGEIESISIYHDGGSGLMLVGVYTDASGSPDTRLDATPMTSVNSSAGWQKVTLNSPVFVSSGQTVWLAWVFQTNPGIKYTAGTPGRANSPATWAGGMPTSFGSSDMANYIYSIFCDYTAAVDPCENIISIDGCGSGNSQTFNSEGSGNWPTTANACNWRGYGEEQIYSFTAPVTGTYTLEVTEATGGYYVDYLWKTGSCSWEGWTCINDVYSPGSQGSMMWEAGTTYYILLDDEDTNPSTHTFYLDCGSSSYPLGNTNILGTSTTVANRRAVPVTASEDGSIESISIYHNGGTGSMLLGVYSDASGSPNSRLGVTSTTTVNSSEDWQTLNLTSPVSVTAGQTVWLTWVFESNPGVRYTAGSTPRANSPDTWSGGMPTSFGSSTMANYSYSIYCTFTPGTTATYTLGNTEIFGTSTSIANRRAVPVTASEASSIESISIYHNGGSGSMLLGVYSDASGSPGSRLGVSSITTVSSSEGWQTVHFSSPVSIAAGQTVWLAWVFETNPGIRYSAGFTPRANSPETWPGGMPVSFGSSSMANYSYSIYCTCSTGEAENVRNLKSTETKTIPIDEDPFLLYPNPTTGKLTVNWSRSYESGFVLTLMNSVGEKMKVLNIESNRGEVELDLGDCQPGMYFILISDPGEDRIIHKGKVIKNK